MKRITHLCLCAIALAFTTGPAFPAYSDKDIAGAVERRLERDPAIFKYDITVAVKDGVVTLTGTVNNLLEKQRASKIASSRQGVRTVVNTLTVNAGSRSADDIQADVKAALASTPALAAQEIQTNVRGSLVQLSGKVHLYDLIGIAEHVASSVYGVTGVENDISMTPLATERSDEEIASHIRRRFASDVWLSDVFIDVTVDGGAVTLSGSVGSHDQRARTVARAWVSGVKSVNDAALKIEDLSVDTTARDPDETARLSDEEILTAIKDGIATHSWIVSQNVGVSVEDGAVTLEGKVNYLAAKQAAASVAMNTSGVKQVLNQILVEPETAVPDETLAEAVMQAWSSNPYTRAHKIEADANQGVVTLTGMMPSSFERQKAAVAVANIYGVREIDNQIKVDHIRRGYHPGKLDEIMAPFPSPSEVIEHLKSDAEIKAAIEDELEWSWFVEGNDVEVTVEAGVAKLRGTVPSERSLKAALRAAADGGAGSIVNELTIK